MIERGTAEHLIKREIPRLLQCMAETEADTIDGEIAIDSELFSGIEYALTQALGQLDAFMCATAKASDQPDDWRPPCPEIEPIRALAREVGYAIGVHGSLIRDFDLIAAPWTDDAVAYNVLIDHLCNGLNANLIDGPTGKPLGRRSCCIQIKDRYLKHIDLSIMPRSSERESGELHADEEAIEYSYQKHPGCTSRTLVDSIIRKYLRFIEKKQLKQWRRG